ncbi:GRIP and coiled-coil domain-containing protein 1-like [Uloborus diversus]|uniref:GRIP and coiled-coil domain-containing protein 1-like n=1 Tax=Uloborus diversus TaxID=327109 RepID=UPI0024091890|nr:GRIP and coiled-coil domain-containing protein 1-like [Uloborus diversus]
MEKKNKKELLICIEEQNKSLLKYKSRLHDLVESYKHLVKEKEALENTIKTLTDAGKNISVEENDPDSKSQDNSDASAEKNDACLQMLKSSLGALTVEKSRIENELRTDRKKLLQQKDELERNLVDMENKYFLECEKYENQILELKKKISSQQREREKEQQDHSLMLKELQNLLAVERINKERLEDQVSELQRSGSKLSEKKISNYESCIEELQNDLKVCRTKLLSSEARCEKLASSMKKMQSEMEDLKLQYLSDLEEEKKRADMAEDKLKLLTVGKEKRIANLESRISELSEMLGNYDKQRQQDQVTIQHLKEKISQLQVECSAISKLTFCETRMWECNESVSQDRPKKLEPKLSKSDFKNLERKQYFEFENEEVKSDNLHHHCQTEIMQLQEELEQYKAKAELAMKEKYNNNSAALLSDAKASKEIKELKSKIVQLKDQLQASKSQLKTNEEYHSKIIANMEASMEELKNHHRQEIAQIEVANHNQLLELEHQIQKQRERTLALLEEKEKEIGLLKSSFLSSLITREKTPNEDSNEEKENESRGSDQEVATALLSSSLMTGKKDGHLLHYAQEIARKDVEISNLRHSRIQSDSTLRKLQQNYALMEEKYSQEIESLKSRMKLLEAAEDKKGMNIEYLKNVVLRFLKCSDPNTKQHMINAIATILHFTRNEVQEVNSYCKHSS